MFPNGSGKIPHRVPASFQTILLTYLAILEYLITVQHLLNVHNGTPDFIRLAKKDNLTLLNQFKTFGIILNAHHVNGMTPFDLAYICTVIRYSRVM